MINKDIYEQFSANIKFKEICIGLLSRYYTWNIEQINEFKDIINYDDMMFMKNDKVLWSLNLIELLKDKMDWSSLWKTNGLELNLIFFKQYEKSIDFSFIHHHKNIDWSNQLLDTYKDKWDWKGLSHKSIVTSPRNLDKYGDLLDWEWLSRNNHLALSEAIINQYKDYWDWIKLCANPKFKISHNGIIAYQDYLDWYSLSRNPSMIPFILAFPAKYEWNWRAFVQNPDVVFGKSLIKFLLTQFKKQTNPRFDNVQKTFQAKYNLLQSASFRLDFNTEDWFKDEFLDVIQFKEILKRKPEILSAEQIEKHIDLNDFDKVLPYRIVQKLSKGYIKSHLKQLLKFRWSIFRYGLIDEEFIKQNSIDKDWFQLAFNECFNWDSSFLINNLERFESNYGLCQNRKLYSSMFSEASQDEINNLLRHY